MEYIKGKGGFLRNFIEKFGDMEIKSYLCKRIENKDNSIEIKDTGFRCLTGTGILYFYPSKKSH